MTDEIDKAIRTLGDVTADILEEGVGTARQLQSDDPWNSIVTLTALGRDIQQLVSAASVLARRAEIERDRAEH